MQRSATRIRGLTVTGSDGRLGKVGDLFFDDERWAVRYLVLDTARWLPGRAVLISPHAVRPGAWGADEMQVDLVQAQVRNSPPVELPGKVSRRYEVAHATFYGYPYYWAGPYLWGERGRPGRSGGTSGSDAAPAVAEPETSPAEASHLRSCAELIGVSVTASNGSVGTLDDMLVDDETWGIPYLVVDRRDSPSGGLRLIPPDSVAAIDGATGALRLTLTCEAVTALPEYRP